jgi:hypothetical protein
MVILFIAIILLLILLYANRLYINIREEGFDSKSVDRIYKEFMDFYIPFCKIWHQSIITAMLINIPQKALTSPKQVASSSIPTVSDLDMDKFIVSLAQEIEKELPQICTTLPEKITNDNIESIITKIPSDATPYINALEWMNMHMKKAHTGLDAALKGKRVEGFDCQDLERCLAENPSLLKQAQKDFIKDQDDLLAARIIQFFSKRDVLMALMNENNELVAKSNKIKEQAQSGEILNQMNITDNSYYAPIQQPDGASTLSDLKKNDPAKYNQLQKQSGAWAAVKGLMEQINSNLN